MAWGSKSRHERGYGAEWVRLREQVMKRDRYVCQPCHAKKFVTLATAVDHIIPKSKGGDDSLANLQAICDECHEEKTVAESGGTRKPRIGLDGWPE